MSTTDTKRRFGIWPAVSFHVFFFVFVFIAGCWPSGTSVASDGPSVIHAGSELDFRPYSYTDKDGRPIGFGVELLRAAADKMGLPIRFTPGPWDQVWNRLVQGEIDVLPVVARTSGREPLVEFSLPHTETFDAFFVPEGRPELPSLAAAAGKEIVVLRSDAAHHELVERKFAGKVIPVDSIPDGLRLIAAGRHDAMLCSKLVGVLELGEADIKGVMSGPPIPDYKRVFSFAVKKGDVGLLEKLNQGLLILKANGQYDQIYRHWLVAEEPWRRLQPYFKATLAGLVVLGLMVAALQWVVRKRTRELALELAERRKAEAALQQANATLELRVAERTAKLRESEARLAMAASGTGFGIFDRDLKTDEIKATEQNVTLLGMKLPTTTITNTTTLSQFYNFRDWAERVHPEDLPRVKEEMDRCMAEHAPFDSEYRVIRLDGSVHWLAARGLFVYDNQGAPARLLGIQMDVTERKRAEQQVRLTLEAMTRLHGLGTLFVREGNLQPVLGEIVDAAIAITGASFGNIQLLDPATGELGIVAQHGLPQWWLDYWNRVAKGQGTCGTALERGERVIVEDVERSPIFVGTPGLEIQLRAGVRAVQSTPLVSRTGKTLGMLSTHYEAPHRPDEHALRLLDLLALQAADIIERARIEATLRESEERLRLAQTAGRVGVWDWNARSGELRWTPELEEIYGLEPGSVHTYEDFRRRVHPDDLAMMETVRDEAVAQHRGFEVEFRILQPSGKLVWVYDRGAASYDGTAAVVHVFGVNIDITERKLAEREREVTVKFLQMASMSTGIADMVMRAAEFLQEQSGCEAVGIRLAKEGDYPYFETRGFSKEFVEAESSLCSRDATGNIMRDEWDSPVLACMCGNIIRGRFDPSKPFFSEGGSFWSNGTTELLASTTDAGRQACTRNRCNGEGYESVASIALKVGTERLGLIQLNDRRKGIFTPELIALWERLAEYLSVALAKFRTEEALKASLVEKEVLLRELAHRTKNNMQVISGLISLQAATVPDRNLMGALSDTQDRIRAMALVHEKLHRSGNFVSLNIKDYGEDLLKAVLGAHHVTGGRVRTETDLDDVDVSIDAGLPLGLIINELASNSLKHAFPAPISGAIFLSLRCHGGRTEMRYRDDGPGLPRDFDLSKARSLGLQLVQNLATIQLRGRMEIRHGSDTEYVFTFGDLTHMAGV